MAIFTYRVARSDGSIVDGQIEGVEEAAVRGRLESQGLLVFTLHQRSGAVSGQPAPSRSWGKLPLGEFLIFNQEFLALVKSGLPVLRVWELLIERAQHTGFQQALREVRQDIRGGTASSDALATHPTYFPELYIATVKAGEQSGNLPEVLQRYIGYLKLMMALRQKVTKALSYPLFLVLIGVGVIAFLLTFVMPTFVSVYGENAKTLPWATQLLMDVVRHGEAQLIPALLILGAGGLALRAYYATPTGRLTIDRFLLALPLIGPIMVKHHTVQLTRTLGTILAGGTPLVEALHIARGAVSNRWVRVGLDEAESEIREGATLATALERPRILPKLAIEMVSVGEETGSLESMLRDVGDFYEADLDTRLSQVTTWIEPVLLLVMGVLVGAIVIVMYLPVFQMAGTIG
ncbi:type II secretion system F family protein [Nitrospira lenta]|uniref:General secretion pathway protein F n=1 Tax=Nitrospira lenta TaxID=1436998 RepID=A0A330L9Z4_9BACT|nr:type II secretion system F family protein [Nitrospira lenta]SPP66117.1 General secretion pathway protein F [Nitrospira lenta]